MRVTIIALALTALQAVHAFAPGAVGIGLRPSASMTSSRAVSGMRVGASGVAAARMASAYDFELPLVGSCRRFGRWSSFVPLLYARVCMRSCMSMTFWHYQVGGGAKKLSDYSGKVILIENVASL